MDLYFSVIKYRIYPIIPALFLILFPSYYSKNYSSIMCTCLLVYTCKTKSMKVLEHPNRTINPLASVKSAIRAMASIIYYEGIEKFSRHKIFEDIYE